MTQMPLPSVPVLAPALTKLGLPAPTSVQLLGTSWSWEDWRLRFAGRPDRILRRPLGQLGVDVLHAEVAARGLLSMHEGVPTSVSFELLAEYLLPWPAALWQPVPGQPGVRWAQEAPERESTAIQAIGELMGRLSRVPIHQFGLRPVQGHFAPSRATWSAEWLALSAAWHHRARGSGSDMGSLADAAWARIQELSPALDRVGSFALVHGDLHPGQVFFEPSDEGTVSGVTNWGQAVLGDPLVEWVLPLQLKPDALHEVIVGFGQEEISHILGQSNALARLEIYLLTDALRRSALASELHRRPDGRRLRTTVLAQAMHSAHTWLQPDAVANKLKGAIDTKGSGRINARLPAPNPAQSALLHALEAVRLNGTRSPLGEIAAISIALLAHLPESSDRWLPLVVGHLTKSGTIDESATCRQPIPDRTGWCKEMSQTLFRHAENEEKYGALAAWWVALEGLASLNPQGEVGCWPVSDAVLRGIESWVWAIISRERSDGATPWKTAPLAASLVAVCAAQRLQTLAVLDPSSTAERWHDNLLMALDDQEIFGGGASQPPVKLSEALARLPGSGLRIPADFVWLPTLLLACHHLQDEMGVPDRALRALNVGSLMQ